MTATNPTKTKEYILELSADLFAEKGYEAASMRTIAREAGLTPAALYYYFRDKQELYVAAMQHAFNIEAQGLKQALQIDGTSEERLKHFVYAFTELTFQEDTFRRFFQRSLLETNPDISRLLAKRVFKPIFDGITQLCEDCYQELNPSMTTITLISVIIGHISINNLAQHYPGAKEANSTSEQIADHIWEIIAISRTQPA